MKKQVYRIVLFSILLVTHSCGDALAVHRDYQVKKVTWLITNGGRVDWSHSGNNLIVYDHLEADGYYDIYTMNPDGSNVTPITPNKSKGKLPQKNIGNPAWHPSGKYIVFQAEKDQHPAAQLSQTAPGSGLYNDLWVMTADGNSYYQLTNLSTSKATAVLHPHFNLAGDKLLWSEKTGSTWALKVADFVVTPQPHLENIQTYQPGTQHWWYESHDFNPLNQSEVLFTASCSTGQTFYGMDIYTFDVATQSSLKRLTNSIYWDEHAHYSPDGSVIIWMSSQGTDAVVGDSMGLKSDYWIMNSDGSDQERITFFNETGHPESMGQQTVASDFAFSPDGFSIATYIQTPQDVITGRIARIDFIGPITTTTTIGCPAKKVMGQDNPHLNTLRAFRNEMFINSSIGKYYTALYYRHAPELSYIFTQDTELKNKMHTLLQSIMPTVENILAKREGVIDEDTVQGSIDLIDALIMRACPALEEDLNRLKQDIQSGVIFKTFNVRVKKD